MCAIFERIGKIPEKPKTVYKKIIHLLLEEWDEQRNVSRHSNYSSFETDRKAEFLANLAFSLTVSSRKSIFSKKEVENAYSKIYQDFDLHMRESKLVVQELESHTGLFVQAGFELFEFAHKSLQEYLTADYLVKLPIIPKKLIQALPNEFAIAVAISSNPSGYFTEYVKELLYEQNESKHSYLSKSRNSRDIREIRLRKTLFIKSFVSRLLLEKPDFNKDPLVGLSALKLYSAYLEVNDMDNDQINLFIIDDLVTEFENFMSEIFKRNSFREWMIHYKISGEYDSTSGTRILKLIKNNEYIITNEKSDSEYIYSILPEKLNCRASFSKIKGA